MNGAGVDRTLTDINTYLPDGLTAEFYGYSHADLAEDYDQIRGDGYITRYAVYTEGDQLDMLATADLASTDIAVR